MKSSGCQMSWPAAALAYCSLRVPPFLCIDFVHPSAVIDKGLSYTLQRLSRAMGTAYVEYRRECQRSRAHHGTGRHFNRMQPALVCALRPRAHDRCGRGAPIVDSRKHQRDKVVFLVLLIFDEALGHI